MNNRAGTSGTVDLLAELDAIRERARAARERITSGEAKNGIAALDAIEKRAADAIRHATAAPNAQPDTGRT